MLFVFILIFSAVTLSSCADEETKDNIYKQRLVINQDTLFKFIQTKIKSAEPRTKTVDGKFILFLGSNVWYKEINDKIELEILAKYFDYNPNDDYYIIEYRLEGVYGGTNAMKRLEYYPHELLMMRDRYQTKINLNETWTCVTYDDILDAAETGLMESECYSYKG
ncbi:hypothetical protein COV93_08570 [Candidatus Woesearchaeota archaeon CG11_big_fil_rev_8_21_14_0_20_43_8]|nr:MAG: hypothetical protein COV93_08570 [Candidatus Woesearchaeota archaeon CG11_big_fil_rev_8_21_14_0_20_43_8]